MPTSSDEGKQWLIDRIVAKQPDSVLDIGAGSGTYARLLIPRLPGCHMTAVEIHAPYVHDYQLSVLYDFVIIGDARTCDLPSADVVIMGDVVEHMTKSDALGLWNRARALAQAAVFVSMPIVEWPQGEMFGNPHEAHRHTWSHDDVMALPGVIGHWTGQYIGVYDVAPG